MTRLAFPPEHFLSIAIAVGALLLPACSCDDPKDGEAGARCSVNEDCNSGVCTSKNVCAAKCQGDECSPGFYCGEKAICTRDCGSDAGGCDEGEVCTANGTCMAFKDGGLNDANCPDVTVNAAPVVPTVIVLVDQSGSMTSNFGGPNRWNAVRNALVDMTTGVVTTLESKVNFGVTLYTWEGPNGYANMNPKPSAPPCPQLTAVAPALNNLAAIKSTLENNTPLDDTPTAESVAAVAAAFPASDGPRVLVLATDGDPDSCDDPDSNGDNGPRQASESAVQAAYSAGITTYVLSVGTDATESHLERLARAGQGQNLSSGAATPYIATSPAELSAALSSILTGVRTCDFKLDGTVATGNESLGSATYNGTPIEYGVDWTLENGNSVKLLEPLCSEFLASDDAVVKASFPCGTILL
ncbi:MAG: VWA domain-containing protein [Polyangiales bacterium]|nr:VWA domain-containing protein [Myxococcales bacterium]